MHLLVWKFGMSPKREYFTQAWVTSLGMGLWGFLLVKSSCWFVHLITPTFIHITLRVHNVWCKYSIQLSYQIMKEESKEIDYFIGDGRLWGFLLVKSSCWFTHLMTPTFIHNTLEVHSVWCKYNIQLSYKRKKKKKKAFSTQISMLGQGLY